MASYCWLHINDPEFFLRLTPYPVDRLRRLCLQLQHLNRIKNPITNCARQYLTHEFPEVANRKSYRQKPDDLPALWGWLATERPSPYFDRMWLKSVAQDFELEISEFTRASSRRICDIERQESVISKEIQQLISLPAFVDYNSVFDEFGFGIRVRELLLSHIYKRENFLGSDTKPVVEVITTDKDKVHKRDRSLRAFKLKLGMGLIEDTTVQSQRWIPFCLVDIAVKPCGNGA